MEFITSKVPTVASGGDLGRIASYLRAHKQELNHALESLMSLLSARIKGSGGTLAQRQGEADGWLWRTFGDGTAECTRRFVCEGVKCTTAWGGMYISPDFGGFDFPFEFSETPSLQMSITGTGERGYLLGYPSGTGSATSKNTGKWWFARGSSSGAEDAVTLDVRAFGRLRA